ncbi:MAG: prepilin-type N-terminal cleavage/methylation domain-containing protein [Candidatus Portnoybacteria bacterium]|nr:prepilin-type N-terminal cleavage/methylation domain-containing protein [Candidatus Portnoybacteria bacterium]
MRLNHNKGFTLIELLVVIAIIGLLSTIILVSLNTARTKARDSKRLSDMHQIILALEMYYSDNNTYPTRTADSCCDGWDQGPCQSENTFIDLLVSQGYMTTVPNDPAGGSGTGCYGYNYYRYGAGSYGCNSPFYVLGIRDMETSGRPHSDSPGWSCPSRNWQNEFDWVTGGFE